MDELIFEHCLDQLVQSISDVDLNKSELLITLIPQDLSKETNRVINLAILPDGIDDRGCPLNDQVLKPIPLVQIGIHVLLHRLPR